MINLNKNSVVLTGLSDYGKSFRSNVFGKYKAKSNDIFRNYVLSNFIVRAQSSINQ